MSGSPQNTMASYFAEPAYLFLFGARLHRLRKDSPTVQFTHALCQGTTSVVPKSAGIARGFNPCGMTHLTPRGHFSNTLKSPTCVADPREMKLCPFGRRGTLRVGAGSFCPMSGSPQNTMASCFVEHAFLFLSGNIHPARTISRRVLTVAGVWFAYRHITPILGLHPVWQ